VTIGVGRESAERAVALSEAHPQVHAAVGVHPHDADDYTADDERWILALARHPKVVAIGECGLDFYRERAPHDVQARAFEGQVELAAESGKALVIHTREAAAETMAVLRRFEGRVVLHCFALADELDEVIERGWWTSFAGNVTYPSAVPLQEAARRMPLERLLVETDSPYLAPVPHRGRPCRPQMVLDTLRFIAELRGVEPDELAEAVVENADAAFALPG
jgi:TatD DNase family protein